MSIRSFAFHNHNSLFRKNNIRANQLRTTLLSVCIDFQKQVKNIDIIFVDDETLLQMNRDYLQHDYYTDIITFDLTEEQTHIQGELYISQERLTDNAAQLSCTLHDEILRVCIHGVLHLCGMDDASENEKLSMRQKENQYILQYNHMLPS